MDDVWLDSGVRIPLGKWASDPCWRCHRQPEPGEHIQVDWIAHTVLCERCVNDDHARLARALTEASKRLPAATAQQQEQHDDQQDQPNPVAQHDGVG